MALTTKFLEELGIEEELRSKIFVEHGKTIQPKLDELKTAQEQIAQLSEAIKTAPTSQAMEDLQNKITAYEKADTERKAAEEKAKQDALTDTAINSAVGERKFINEFTKDSIFSAIKTELAKDENKGKGASEILEVLTKDKENIFVNARQQPKMPNQGAGVGNTNEAAAILASKYKNNPFYNG